MTYRGIPYVVTQHTGYVSRFDPYASNRHRMPDRTQGVRCTRTPRSRRRLKSYAECNTVRPASTTLPQASAGPELRDVEPARVLSVLAALVLIAIACSFAGIGLTNSAIGYLDEALGTEGLVAVASDSALRGPSTPQSAWEQGSLPTLYQADTQWAARPYGNGTLGTDGSAPLSLAMVHIGLTGDTTLGPVEVASFAHVEGYAKAANPTTLLEEGAGHLGLQANRIEAREPTIRRELLSGRPIIALVGSGVFGSGLSAIVLTDVNERGQLVVHDPSSEERSCRCWDFDEVIASSIDLWSYTAT